MTLKTNWTPGETGLTDAVNDAAALVNDHATELATRLSPGELSATMVRATGSAWRQAGRRWLFIGTSILNGSNASNVVYAYGWQAIFMLGSWRAAPGASGGSVFAAVPGSRLQANVDRIAGLIEAHQPEAVFLEVGPNDSSDTAPVTTLAGYQATVAEAIALVRAAGLPMVLTTPSPLAASASPTAKFRIAQQAAFIRLFAQGKGVQVADFHRTLLDPSTGALRTAYDSDGIHPNGLGHLVLAQEAATAMARAVGVTPTLPVVANGLPGSLTPNPLLGFTGTDPTDTGNAVPPTGAVVRSMEASDSTGRRPAGNWHVVAVDATAAVASFQRYAAVSASWAVGDVLAICGYIEVTDENGTWVNAVNAGSTSVRLSLYNQSQGIIGAAMERTPGVRVASNVYALGPYYTRQVVPAGTTSIQLRWGVSAALGTKFTARFAVLDVVNLTTLGLA